MKFSVFEYLNRRRRFISIMSIFAQEGFNVTLKKPGADALFYPRLAKFEEQIRNLNISGVALGAVGRGLRSNVEKSGDEIFRQCINNQC